MRISLSLSHIHTVHDKKEKKKKMLKLKSNQEIKYVNKKKNLNKIR